MFCSKCGAPKPTVPTNFCTKCGTQFSKESIEDIRDNYQINVGVSTAIGLSSGIITVIFSAAISQIFHFEWWGWAIILVVTGGLMTILLFSSFKTIKNSLERQLKRK